MGCDSLVALPAVTAGGVTVFAKNSDRPPRECQRVVPLAAARHPAGARVQCQYIDIPQVAATAAVIGFQPYWLWGFEHGVNEHRVAIGNQTVFAREPLGPLGLLGMDLVRLGLERAGSAEEALHVITGLIETHGQGGSGQAHLEWPYHNAFLIADPTAAWILETSDRHWAARRVREIGNVSNGLALGTEWERGSADLTAFAVAQGWWSTTAGRVDFTRAYADDSGVPPNLCAARRQRAATLLAAEAGRITMVTLRDVLRDHFGDGTPFERRPFDDPQFFSLCMHADPLDNTTAAMVARLPADADMPAAVWACLGSPCVGAFVPCYVDGVLPDVLGIGGAEPGVESPWWGMRELLTLVERDFARFGPLVRARWNRLEGEWVREADRIERDASALRRRGRTADAADVLSAFMARTVGEFLAEADALRLELADLG